MRAGKLGKPFHHRLPQRLRTWNLRRERREKFERLPLRYIQARRRRLKPRPVKNALARARAMSLWGQVFDPECPF